MIPVIGQDKVKCQLHCEGQHRGESAIQGHGQDQYKEGQGNGWPECELKGSSQGPCSREAPAKAWMSDKKVQKLSKIQINDLKAEILEQLLSYIYLHRLFVQDRDVFANSLLAAAESYKLPGLKSKCEKQLTEVITPMNVAGVLMLADECDCAGLKRFALNFCKENHNYIMKDKHWKAIEDEKPDLFAEVISKVLGDDEAGGCCQVHAECIKKSGKRFEFERQSSIITSMKNL